MGFLDSMNISASALTATRLRMDVIAENMANLNTTRTATGDPYRRRYVVFEPRGAARSFGDYFDRAAGRGVGGGVRVTAIGEDPSAFKLDYNPTHPDADADGYVRLPNVDVVQEMVDMMSAYRAYEANITALNTFKDMAVKTLELGKG
ncbi:MAG: flagellar basal body rod protein FlgC [Clostridiales bacterium]|nr:flagellar basal body rod protein FlgC [Clostridiales bacterium]